jgi:hypothetical protein
MRPAIIVLVVSLSASVAFAQNTTVTLKKLVEKREVSVEKTPFSGWNNGIELTLHIDGADVKGARKFGKLTVTRAVDDVGTDLTKAGDGPSQDSDRFEDIREPMSFGFDENKPKPSGFDIELKLPTPSARSAKAIKQISGSVQVLAGGEKKVIEVKKLKSSAGKAVDDPVLKQLGVSFTLLDPSKAAPGGMMMMGEKDKSVTSWSDQGDKRVITYFLEKTLSDDMALQIEVWPGQKTIRVPIELKDVKLP